MFDTFLSLLQPTTLLIILAATALGIILGAIPGLSGGLGVALLLPITFGMDPHIGLAMLVSIWIGGVSGGMIGSILLGIPGSPSSIATTFDGYPMTRNGEAVKALGAAIVASFIGTAFSILIAMFLSPFMARMALKLGPWEYFSLGFCAIALVAALARGSIFHGMAAAALGLLLSTVGFAPIDGYARFTFGSIYLSGGIDLIALMLGLFALKQIVQDHARGEQQIPEVDVSQIRGFGVTLREYIDNAWNIVRSFMIGLWIGFLPGMGSALSNMVAYAQAKSASKHPEKFGKGCVDGVFASETSNNASVGGALIPMVALGIPGDGTTAILLGGLMIHGIQAGPLLFANNPDIVYALFLTAILAAVITLVLQYFGMRLFPAILKIPYHYLYPAIVVLGFIGVFVGSSTAFNYVLLLGFAALGLLMDKVKLPVGPFILAFILGPMLELNLRRGITYTDEGVWPFFTRPISALLLLVAAFSIVWPYLSPWIKSRRAAAPGKE
ncbi:tripartite tricarboxylate transporter permease [Pararhodobacter aggregans]|uniref:Tat pathway signal protein n=1 Tax=Pararhodobacter aggregans TaxID=404875 RepID=A0A2T7UMZ4_9RHOB|nr:tripartite tricarboxylate transporter permease [Pararhodobacter aggregans]PTX02451.1 putative tricarboxylic transport membrane protein [Pararhodobacter aggregans]PVE46062.1 Tat pathway signal protein [Pararhodobacter aggregans]